MRPHGGAVHPARASSTSPEAGRERAFFNDNLLVRIHFIIVMIRWTGLAPWEFEFLFPGSLTSTVLGQRPTKEKLYEPRQARPNRSSEVIVKPVPAGECSMPGQSGDTLNLYDFGPLLVHSDWMGVG